MHTRGVTATPLRDLTASLVVCIIFLIIKRPVVNYSLHNQLCHSIISSGPLKESVIMLLSLSLSLSLSLFVCGNTSQKIPHLKIKNSLQESGLIFWFTTKFHANVVIRCKWEKTEGCSKYLPKSNFLISTIVIQPLVAKPFSLLSFRKGGSLHAHTVSVKLLLPLYPDLSLKLTWRSICLCLGSLSVSHVRRNVRVTD